LPRVVKHAPLVLLLGLISWARPAKGDRAALEYLRRKGGDVSAALVTAERATDVSLGTIRRLKRKR